MYFKGRNTSFFLRGHSTSSLSRTQEDSECKQEGERTTAILTDTPSKMLSNDYNAGLGANEETWAKEKRKEKRVQHFC